MAMSASVMAGLIHSNMRNNVKAEDYDLTTEAGQEAWELALFTEMCEGIITNIKAATISSTVTVTSVSGVTTGPGVSGPGTGTSTGTIT